MRTSRLVTIHALVATRFQHWWGEGLYSPMNKFEQVSSDGHQMSLAEGGTHMLRLEGAGLMVPKQ